MIARIHTVIIINACNSKHTHNIASNRVFLSPSKSHETKKKLFLGERSHSIHASSSFRFVLLRGKITHTIDCCCCCCSLTLCAVNDTHTIITNGRNVLFWKPPLAIGQQETSFTDGTVTYDDTLNILNVFTF